VVPLALELAGDAAAPPPLRNAAALMLWDLCVEVGASTFCRVVALQFAFERQTLKPVFHLIGYRLWF
jgi:hypothetical protein